MAGIDYPGRPGAPRERVDVAVLLQEAVTTDGAHHKQWYLEQLAAALRVVLPDHAPGIAP